MLELLVASDGTRGDGFEQGKEVGLAIVWESDDFLLCVDLPSKDEFLCAPGRVAFAELLEGYWFLLCNIVLVVQAEEVVDGAKEMLYHIQSLRWLYLCYTNEVIEV